MAFRISEKEYAALLENRDKHAEHGEEPYINGRPADTVLRGHNAPPADEPAGPVQKGGRSLSPHRRYGILDDAKDHEGLIASAFAFEAFAKNPLMFIIVGIPAFFATLALTKPKTPAAPAEPVVYRKPAEPGQPLLYRIQRWFAGL